MASAGFKESEIKSAISQIKLPTGFKSLEGLLFPAQYSFAKDTSAIDALQVMVDRATSELSKSGISTSSGKYSEQKLLTMASIIQAEGKTKDFVLAINSRYCLEFRFDFLPS